MKTQDILNDYDHFLVDLWGVVWDGRTVFPEAVEFCQNLVDAGKDLLFLSNVAELVVEELVRRLREAGFVNADEGWLATSGQAMDAWFRQNGMAGEKVYVFGGDGIRENVRRAGATPLRMPDDGTELASGGESEWLVIGGMLNFKWHRLSEIVTGIRAGGLKIIIPNPDQVVIRQNGQVRMPTGMVAHIIETALPDGLEIHRIGKPYPFIYDYAFERFGAKARRDRTLMIGDSLDTDVRGARDAGIPSLLLGQGVHQGLTLAELESLARSRGLIPNFLAERLAQDEEMVVVDKAAS